LTPSDIIDLSHTLASAISVYPGSEKPVINTVAFLEHHGFREKQLILSTHHGTHIDCPFHLLTEGFHAGNAPLKNFFGKGLVIDCRKYDPAEHISSESLHSQEAEITRADFLLLCTGMDKHWNTPLYNGPFPVLTQEAAEYLTRFSLKGVGIDTLSVDPVEDTILGIHKTLLSRNIIIIENLTDLDQLLNKEFWFSCFPLKIEEGDGSPVRACAITEEFES
jgi:arylformamidase